MGGRSLAAVPPRGSGALAEGVLRLRGGMADGGIVYRRRSMAFRSGITRGFDLSLPSNRFVLLGTPAAGVVAGVVTLLAGDGPATAVRHGFSAGGATFIAWAVVRELHPDRPVLAALAAVVAPLGLVAGDPDLLAAAVVLLGARVVAGTTGRAMRWVDVAIVGAVAFPVAMRPTGSGVLTSTAIALLAVLPVQDRRRLQLATGAVLVAGLAALGWWGFEAGFDPDPWSIAAAALGASSLMGPRRVTAGTDRSGGRISPRRVRAARGFALIAAAAAAVGSDPATMAPVWTALAATGSRPT